MRSESSSIGDTSEPDRSVSSNVSVSVPERKRGVDVQGMALVHHIFGNDPDSKPAFQNVASAVFTTPQIATLGYTEERAREEFPNLNIFTSVFRRVSVAN